MLNKCGILEVSLRQLSVSNPKVELFRLVHPILKTNVEILISFVFGPNVRYLHGVHTLSNWVVDVSRILLEVVPFVMGYHGHSVLRICSNGFGYLVPVASGVCIHI